MAKKRIANKHVLFHGLEPDYTKQEITEDNYDSVLGDGLNYYSTIALKEKKKYFVKWAKEQGATSDEVSAIPTDFLIGISSQARMEQRGFEFNAEHKARMLDKLDSLMADFPYVAKVIDPKVEEMKEFAKKQAIDNLIGKVMAQFDNVIDAQMSETKQMKAPAVDCSKLNVGQKQELVEYYTKQLIELKLVYNKADPELMEGYAGIPRARINKMMKLHVNILNELQEQQLLAQAKKPRKVRARKVKTPAQLTAKVKSLPEHKEYGLKSVPVTKLINCTEAWVFNTKKRKLQYYYSSTGMSVKGTTLQNFEKGTSSQKTIRKPKEFLGELLKLPKVKSKKTFDDVNAKATALTGRINEHCIILKVY